MFETYKLRPHLAILTSLPPQPIGEATKASKLQRIPPGVQGTMAEVDINTLTMEQYLALSRENHAPGVVKPEIRGNVNFKIKSQFMRELRENTFFENKNEDAHDHIYRVLSIVSLFNILGVSKDAVMLRVFPFTLTGAANCSGKQVGEPGTRLKKLKESVHAIHVGCQIFEGPRLDKDCPLNEEVKQVEEVKYGEFRRTTPFKKSNGGKFRVGPPGYYTRTDNCAPYGKRRPSLEELFTKHQEESARKSTKMEVWIKKLQENADINARNQSASLKNLETQIEQLTKEIHLDKSLSSSSGQIKTVTADQEAHVLNNLHGVPFIYEIEDDTPEVLQHQLPPKELNLGSFTLPCIIGNLNYYAMADLDMSKMAPMGIVENILDNRYAEWCDISPSSEVSSQESNKPRPRDYTFREWKLIKDDSFIVNNPTHRSFDDYKWEFNLEIDKLADEYELGIRKKGHILNNIWEYCNQVHTNNYGWHNHGFEEDERKEMGIESEDYHPAEVQVETFKVKKYSFEGGQSFVCISKDLDDVLHLGRKNESKFKGMIRKEDSAARRHLSRPAWPLIMW
ncbi:hypothetical protein Tco_0228494 [Tanacetum coccineum]